MNIFKLINTSRLRWLGHVVRMGEKRNVYKILMGNMKERVYLKCLVVDWMSILDK